MQLQGKTWDIVQIFLDPNHWYSIPGIFVIMI